MKSTKKSLLLSTLSLIMCIAMLLGTTYAWFTDSVTSGKNIITAGNLDIELEYFDGSNWKPVTDTTSLFDNNALWEPGYTEVAYLRLSNKGTLALKYNLAINVYSEKAGTNVAGESFKLSDYINMGVVENWNGTVYADRATARSAVSGAGVISAYTKSGNMVKGAAAETFAVVVYMPEEIGNVANHKTGTDAPQIEMGVAVNATQLASEVDSFDENYDLLTPWLGGTAAVPAADESGVITIKSAEQLAGFANSVTAGTSYAGKTIKLANDLDLNNINFPTAKGGGESNFVFDGNGKTIKNLKIAGQKGVGLFQYCSGVTVKNLTVDGADVSGINQVGVIFGQAMCATIENCKVKNATVVSSVYKNDDGDKAGALVGYLTAQPKASIKDCVVENCTVKGYRDVGGAVGYIQAAEATNVSVKNTTVICDKANNYKKYTTDAEFDAGKIFGEQNSSPVLNNCTDTNTKVIYANGTSDAIAQQIATAEAGDTVKLLPSETPIALPDKMTKGINIVGNGEDSVIAVNSDAKKTLAITGPVTFENLTFAMNGNKENAGAVSITGNATFKDVTVTPAADGSAPKKAIVVGGDAEVTFENVNFALNGNSRAIMVWGGSPKVYVKNCTFDCTYPFNADAGHPEFIVTDSTLNGWTSYTNTATASFTNCKFGKSTSGYEFLRPYNNVTLTNCEFSADFKLDCGAEGIVITLNNCTQAGAPVTASIIEPSGSKATGKLVIDGVEYDVE